MTVDREFIEALGGDVVIPNVGPSGRALSLPEALAVRDWFDTERRRKPKPPPVIGAEPDGWRWKATCVACPKWRGDSRPTAGDAYKDGREHQRSEHGYEG